MNNVDFTLKYKPKSLSDTILPEELRHQLSVCLMNSLAFPYLLTGPTGVGKTLIATNLREEIHLLSCLDGCSDSAIANLKASISSITLSGGRRLVVLDDVDHLNPSHQLRLIEVLDRFSVCNDFIGTANEPFRLKPALLSRFQVIKFGFSEDRIYRNLLVEHLLRVANLENYSDFPKLEAQKIVRTFYPDIRKMLRQLQTQIINQTRQ